MANPFAPERLMLSMVGRHGKRLDTYAEFMIGQSDAVSAGTIGFKTKFVGGEVKGNISTTGKVQSVYKKFVGMFDLELQSTMDFSNLDKEIQFGVGLSLRQMM